MPNAEQANDSYAASSGEVPGDSKSGDVLGGMTIELAQIGDDRRLRVEYQQDELDVRGVTHHLDGLIDGNQDVHWLFETARLTADHPEDQDAETATHDQVGPKNDLHNDPWKQIMGCDEWNSFFNDTRNANVSNLA